MKRRSRSAKLNAKKLIKTVTNKAPSVSDEAVVTVDPFMVNKSGKISGFFGPVMNQDDESETQEGGFSCRWQLGVGIRGICPQVFESPDQLTEHIMKDHADYGTKGFACNWAGCAKKRTAYFVLKSEFEGHLKFHSVIAPEDNEEDFQGEESSDESYDEKKEPMVTDSDCSDDFSMTRKRKKSHIEKKTTKISKRMQSGEEETKPKEKPVAVAKPVPRKEFTPVALSFYRFTCLWEVPFVVNSRTNPKPQTVTCSRKFTVLEESIEHLHGHHLGKVRNKKGPYKCSWKKCASKDLEFKTIEELEEHVILHTEEKMITFTNNHLVEDSRRTVQKVTQKVEKPKNVPSSAVAAKEATAKVCAIKSAPVETKSLEKSTENHSKRAEKEIPEVTGHSWMIACLRALLSAKVKEHSGALCPSAQLCLYCRYHSLQNRFANKGTSHPYQMYEFNCLHEKFNSCENELMKFVESFLYDAISHEKVFHDGKTLEECIWTESVDKTDKLCNRHPLNHNLVNLFNVNYKNCLQCTEDSSSWPTPAHQNLVINLGADERIRCPDLLIIKGKVYQLCAVVCYDDAAHSYTYVRLKNMWVAYYESSSNMVDASEVLEDKRARIVVYIAKDSGRSSKVPIADFDGKSYTFEECKVMPNDENQHIVMPDIEENGMLDVKPEVRSPSYAKSPNKTQIKAEGGIESLFASRQLINVGDQSCINSVLQALLTTSLAVVVKKLCSYGHRCFFCRMLSFTQRAICAPKGTSIKPLELSLHKEELGITSGEGDPAVYISNLISEIIADEKAQHNSNDTKYRFMIRLQKKSCDCSLSFEAYHWALSPTKKNESLFDLMTKCTMYCTQCNVMTTAQPIQMPDNLIITIEKSDKRDDTSVHYPDEWASYNTRYFLAAVIVDGPSCDKGSEHYSTYCKVFGKWMLYDDDKAAKSSSCDVLGNKRARVLVYVGDQLTPQAVQDALVQAKSLSAGKKGSHHLDARVKLEPMDMEFLPANIPSSSKK